MAKFRGAIVVDTERCKGCGVCITACPCGVIELATYCLTNQKILHNGRIKTDEG